MNIDNHIIFAGVHKDCEKYYQAMDVFVLPSLFEGLPVTGIEAQYTGLPCLFADTISKEVSISQNARFLGISEKDISKWCIALADISQSERVRTVKLTTDIFDSDKAARNMVLLYKELWEKNPC